MGEEIFIRKIEVNGGLVCLLKAIQEKNKGEFTSMKKSLYKDKIYILNIEVKKDFSCDDNEFNIILNKERKGKIYIKDEEMLTEKIKEFILFFYNKKR